MTVMIPDHYSLKTPSGEKKFFNELKADPHTDGWVALHSLNIAKHKTKTEGECDMVLMIPGHGILIIEVKGVNCHRVDGTWHYDDARKPDLGPFKQAQTARWSIFKNLTDRNSAFSGLVFYSAVIFPTFDFNETSDEWHRWQFLNKSDIEREPYSKSLVRMLEKAHTHIQSKQGQGWYHRKNSRPSLEMVNLLKNALRPDFSYVSGPYDHIKTAETEIRKFTEQQFAVIDSIEANKRNVVSGPAGTGKTLLGEELFRSSANRGHRTLMMCFNQNLGEHLKNQLSDAVEDSDGGSQVSTFHSILAEGFEIPEPADSNFWSQVLPEQFLTRALETSMEPRFDFLILDETQDLISDLYLDCLDFLVVGGLKKGCWTFLGDFDNQNLYLPQEGGSVEALTKLSDRDVNFSRHVLRMNCRNSRQIVWWLRKTLDINPDYTECMNDLEVQGVRWHYWKSDSEHSQKLNWVIEETLKDFRPSDIVLLSYASGFEQYQDLKPEIKAKLCPLNSKKESDRNKIRWSSVHGFKGLESNVVILSHLTSLENHVFYVAMSRAKLKVHALANNRLKERIVGIARS